MHPKVKSILEAFATKKVVSVNDSYRVTEETDDWDYKNQDGDRKRVWLGWNIGTPASTVVALTEGMLEAADWDGHTLYLSPTFYGTAIPSITVVFLD